MTISAARCPRRALVAALAGAAAACSTGAGHEPPPLPPEDCSLASALPAGQPFTVSGNVVYDFVPARYFPTTGTGGLYFGETTQRPVRAADVQVRQCGNVLAATTTDEATGQYTISFTPAAQGQLSVNVLARTATPPITVVDNTAGGAIWTVAQPILSASPTVDVHATHGWTLTGYGASRIAAPFAILDSMYTADRAILGIPRAAAFESFPLVVNWSPFNTQSSIGTSHYGSGTRQIWILGEDGVDTDEFDREVVVHEWAHYFMDAFSRSEDPGGWHSLGDDLDPRLAFSEGGASALAAMVLQDPVYADTYWSWGVMDAFGWDAEAGPTAADDPYPGPFSELSVVRALWDLYDGGTNEPAWDTATLGLGPVHDTLVGPQTTTPALTTIGSFVAGLKKLPGVTASQVDAALQHYGIGPITTDFGDGDPALRAMYQPITRFPYTTAPVTLDSHYACNERPQNQYFVFDAPGVRATVTSSAAYDVDLEVYDAGRLVAGAWSASGNETVRDPSNIPGFSTTPGRTYVVVLTGWAGNDADCRLTTPLPGTGLYTATVTFTSP